ncbi:UNVERIFIED_CONTAM: hypothetical protein HDU68_004858 [Siphonaria sp. JEL0065]|nr:hypothetical protein HDU68_004858 [Siphonaria sp. JEL0065]
MDPMSFQFPPSSSSNCNSTAVDNDDLSQERLLDCRFSLPLNYYGIPLEMQLQHNTVNFDQHNFDQHNFDQHNFDQLARRMSFQYPLPNLGLEMNLGGFEFDATASPALSPKSMIELMSSPIPVACPPPPLLESYSNAEFSRRMSLPYSFPYDSSSLLATFENTPEFYNTNSTDEQGSIDTFDAFTSSPLHRRSSLPDFHTLTSATTTQPHLSSTPNLSVRGLLRNDDSEAGMDVLLASPPTTPSPTRRVVDGSTKLNRFKPTEPELLLLVSIFQKNPFPSANFQKKVAENMGVNVKQIRFWFQNRRATMKHNGIHVLKPKKSGEIGYNMAKKRTSLSPLSAESAYFFVQTDSVSTAANVEDEADFDA